MTDLRQAFRQLQRHPFTNAVIVLTIALLIGAVSVIYASIRNEQARFTPFPDADRILKLWRVGEKYTREKFPAELFHGYAERLTSFERFGAVAALPAMTLNGYGEPMRCNAYRVSAGLLQLTKVRPLMGRLFDDTDTSQPDVAIISEQLWRAKLGAEEDIIGKTLRFDRRSHTIVGVLPASMRVTRLAHEADVWLPGRFQTGSALIETRLFGRLKDGVTPAQAQAELDALAPAIEENAASSEIASEHYGKFVGAMVAQLDQRLRNEGDGRFFIWLFTGVIIACVVGIACFNVANLLLARAVARTREMAVRLAVGASRSRLVRQLLAETMLLAMLGGLLGLAASFWFQETLRFQHVDVRWDWRLYLMTAAGTAGLGILVGLVPALRSARTDLNSTLKNTGLAADRSHRGRNLLVASQVAMAVFLCVVAGAWTRAYLQLDAGRLNFDPTKVVSVRADLGDDADWDRQDWHAYVERSLAALEALPGVESAVVSTGPQIFGPDVGSYLTLGATSGRPEQATTIWHSYVNHGYAELTGMKLLRGRDLDSDPAKAANEALVNEKFVAEHFPGIDPLGLQIRRSHEAGWATVVGVVRDRGSFMISQPTRAEVFFGHRRCPYLRVALFTAQTSADAHVLGQALRRTVRQADANLPLSEPMVAAEVVDRRLAGPRKGLMSLGLMSGVGLFIALLGVGGVVAFTATQRTREIGIRMALGSTRGGALRLVMWQGARLLLAGGLLGMAFSVFIISRLPRHRLALPLDVFDPIALGAVAAIVAIAGFLAALLPARKAANLNPTEALRYE